MPSILIRNIDLKTLTALKQRAEKKHTSLQREVKAILEESARASTIDFVAAANEIREELRKRAIERGIQYADSGEMQREERER